MELFEKDILDREELEALLNTIAEKGREAKAKNALDVVGAASDEWMKLVRHYSAAFGSHVGFINKLALPAVLYVLEGYEETLRQRVESDAARNGVYHGLKALIVREKYEIDLSKLGDNEREVKTMSKLDDLIRKLGKMKKQEDGDDDE